MDPAFVQHAVADYARRFDLRPRIHRVRMTLPPAAGANSPETPINIPTESPFLWCELSWSSNRRAEGIYSSVRLLTEQVIFTVDPVKLGCFGGPDGVIVPVWWGPSELRQTDRFRSQVFRDFVVDPAETYPGNNIPSIIEVAFLGFDLLPRSAQGERQQG